MLTISKYLNGGSPMACRFCNQPFPVVANHFSAWHGQDGSYYCANALEAKTKRLRFLS